MQKCIDVLSIALLLGYGIVTATPFPRESRDGLFVEGVGQCSVVANQGVDTMSEALAGDGTVLSRAASWRGREGRYLLVPSAEAVDVRVTALGRDSIANDDLWLDDCPDELDLEAARALAEAIDLRLTAYFGGQSDPALIGAAFAEAFAGMSADTLAGWRADVLFETAEWHRDSGRRADAAATWSDALELYRQVGDTRGEAATLNSLGLAEWRQGRPVEAALRFEQALSIRQPLGDSFASAAILNNLGLLAAESGDRDTALDHYQQALSIFQSGIELRVQIDADAAAMLATQVWSDGDLGSALNTLNNLAQLYRENGQPLIAERYWQNYLAFEPYLPEALAVAQARYNLGVLVYEQGRLDEALRLLLDAKVRFDTANAGRWQAESRLALARLYLDLDDGEGAWVYAEQAQRLDIGEVQVRSEILRQVGRIALATDRHEQAVQVLERAVALQGKDASSYWSILVKMDLARAELALGRIGTALERQQDNLKHLEQAGFVATAARSRSLLGEILYRRGDREASIQSLQQAQQVQQRLGARLAELETLERLGRIQQQSDPQAAISTNDRALKLLADPRVRRLPEVRRAGFRTRYRVMHERQIALLLDADRSDEAWTVGERARAGDLTSLRDERQFDEHDSDRRATLDRHARLLAELHLLTSKPERDAAEIQRIRAGLDRLETDMHPESRDAPAPSLNAARDALSPNQRLLSFVLGQTRGWVWVIGGPRDLVFAIDDVAGLRVDVEELLAQLRHPRNAIGRVSKLIRAIRDRLPSQVHDAVADAGEVLIQPDRELHALPFALLWPDTDPERSAPRVRRVLSATIVETQATAPAAATVDPSLLVLADPGWNEPGGGEPMYPESSLLTRLLRDSALARLPGTRREAEAIAALGDEGMRIQLKLGRAASRDFVLGGGMAGYPLLHVATHGLVDLEYPELSALLLADEAGAGPAFLRPSDIARLDLNASLVVLSGCDTGHGRVYAGSGAFSLARPFLLAGADQVLASLWKVDDHRTAQFMTRFYHHLLTESLPPDEALALAQKWMRQQPGNAHPYYWAGFVLTAAGLFGQEPGSAAIPVHTSVH